MVVFWNDNYVSDWHLSRWNAPWMNAPDGGGQTLVRVSLDCAVSTSNVINQIQIENTEWQWIPRMSTLQWLQRGVKSIRSGRVDVVTVDRPSLNLRFFAACYPQFITEMTRTLLTSTSLPKKRRIGYASAFCLVDLGLDLRPCTDAKHQQRHSKKIRSVAEFCNQCQAQYR